MTVIEAHNSGQNFQVGQQIDSILSVSNQGGARSVTDAHRVTVVDMLPAGLTSLSSAGAYWQITLSASSSPATLVAVYTGPYPLAAQSLMPPIILSGIFTSSAMPGVTSSVLLGLSDGHGGLQVIATYTVNVSVISSRPGSTLSQTLVPAGLSPYRPTPAADDVFYPGLPRTGY